MSTKLPLVVPQLTPTRKLEAACVAVCGVMEDPQLTPTRKLEARLAFRERDRPSPPTHAHAQIGSQAVRYLMCRR